MRLASHKFFRLIRYNPSTSLLYLGFNGHHQCLQKCLISSTSKLSTFKIPFHSKSSDGQGSDPEEGDDRYVKKWLAQKEFKFQTIEDFKPFLKNDKEIEKMIWILREYDLVKYDTSICPSYLPVERVKELLEINSPERLYSFFHFLYNRENRKNAAKLRRSENRTETAIALRRAHDNNQELNMGILFDPDTGKPYYGKWRNSCFIDLGRKEEYTAFLPQNIASSQFGQKLVIDFSYEDCMLIPEKKSLVKQLMFAHQDIRESEEPFDTWFCNLNDNSRTYSLMEKNFGWDHQAKFTSHFIHRTPKSYLDLFPRDKLIYLCPDSANELTQFDSEAIYIVGGLVDRSVIKPVSLAKCKKEKIKNVRLPLDAYLSMIGSKILTIDQVIKILVNLKLGKSMEESLKASVPERKLKSPEQVEFERNRRLFRLTLQKTSRNNLFNR